MTTAVVSSALTRGLHSPPMSLPEDVPPAAEVPKIITERQGRVMVGVLTVAVVVALGVTGNWWMRRADESSTIAARGNLAIGRGDFANGLAVLASLESSRAPVPVRLSAVRDAAIGSWIGVVSVAAADSALTPLEIPTFRPTKWISRSGTVI